MIPIMNVSLRIIQVWIFITKKKFLKLWQAIQRSLISFLLFFAQQNEIEIRSWNLPSENLRCDKKYKALEQGRLGQKLRKSRITWILPVFAVFEKHLTDERTDRRTDGRTENLPILQDFVPYRGRCPKKHAREWCPHPVWPKYQEKKILIISPSMMDTKVVSLKEKKLFWTLYCTW